MSTFRAVVVKGIRVVALIGILPGAIVAAAYLLVLTEQLYHHWDARTALVLGMAAWGVVGVFELWHVYVRLSRNGTGAEGTPVSPRVHHNLHEGKIGVLCLAPEPEEPSGPEPGVRPCPPAGALPAETWVRSTGAAAGSMVAP